MTLAVRRLFHRQLSVFWATTYECDVVAFDEYFLGQLRQDALNATILADHRELSEAWSALIDTGQSVRLRRVNRDYLLRPVSWHGQSFPRDAQRDALSAKGASQARSMLAHVTGKGSERALPASSRRVRKDAFKPDS